MTHLSGYDGLRMHIYFDSKTQFPVKLYEVANDGYLVKWNADGTSILVDEQDFEDKVMKCYPGFVQIPTFLNFRRLFREYSFEWRIVEGTDSLFEFSHRCFVRGSVHLLGGVKTKRKSVYRTSSCSRKRGLRPLTPSPGKPVLRRRYRRRRQTYGNCFDPHASSGSEYGDDLSFVRSSLVAQSASDFSQTLSSLSDDASSARSSCYNLANEPYLSSDVMDSGDGRVAKEDLNAVLAVYAMNELTDEEYLQLIANKATDCDLSVPAACDTGEITTLLCHEPSPASSEEFVPFDGSSYPSASHGWLYGRYDGYDDDRSPNGSHATLDTEAAMCDGDILDLDAVQGSDTEGSWYSCALDVTNLTPTLNFSGPLEPTGSPWVL